MYFDTISARSNLSASQVLDIRRLHDVEGVNDAQLSRLYAVSRKTIYDIEQRRTWKHVPSPVIVRGYKGYSVYPDGRVYSTAKSRFLTQANRIKGGPVVQMNTSGGRRRLVSVNSLVAKGFRVKRVRS